MSHTLYASFSVPEDAERAAGALLDHGVRAEDLSVVQQPTMGLDGGTMPRSVATNVTSPPDAIPSGSVYGVEPDEDATPKAGITTTTPADAGSGAVQGTIVGVGLGALAALAMLMVPGVGLVLGAGALATALGGVAATAGAGAAAGAIVGYLKDQGMDERAATDYADAVQSGGAVLALSLPSGDVDEAEATAILAKYAATNVNAYSAQGYLA